MQGIWRNAAVAVALVFAVLFGANQLSHNGRIQTPPAAQCASTPVVWSHGREGAARNAEEHWEKHGSEFPEFHSALEYERGALAFVLSPPPGTLTKTNTRGDTLLYDSDSNTFAVRDAQGEPRTFFRPDNGRAYWDRQ
jgi:filamentous hemagglutinin